MKGAFGNTRAVAAENTRTGFSTESQGRDGFPNIALGKHGAVLWGL